MLTLERAKLAIAVFSSSLAEGSAKRAVTENERVVEEEAATTVKIICGWSSQKAAQKAT